MVFAWTDSGSAAADVRAVLLGCGGPRQPRAGQLRRGERFPGRPGDWRQARGLAAVSVAWGLWEAASEMVGESGARVTARGVSGLSASEGLGLLDAALERGQAAVVAARLDATRIAAGGGVAGVLLSGLVRSSGRGRLRARRVAGGWLSGWQGCLRASGLVWWPVWCVRMPRWCWVMGRRRTWIRGGRFGIWGLTR